MHRTLSTRFDIDIIYFGANIVHNLKCPLKRRKGSAVEARSSTNKTVRIGVDSGGTFTDVCILDEATGETFVWKVPSTPSDPSDGIVKGIGESLATHSEFVDQKQVGFLGHGTTVGTNALITGRGAKTGVITTRGFRDLLEIRRQKRPELYNVQTSKPPILASREHRLEVTERVSFAGEVLAELVEEEVREAARSLADEGITAIAICTLFSFLMPAHEKRIRDIVAEEIPGAFISVSHEISPLFREYERLSTTVVNAYLGPIMRNYLERLAPKLQSLGLVAEPHVTQSNGGVISCDTAKAEPVRTVLSGPAAGVTAALAVGRETGFDNIVTFDMGGTSSDIALIDAGRPQMVNGVDVHGYPLQLSMLDIHSVGAGGGSIAYVDNGLLKVGPRSAGANPGPVCYGLGNEEPTVTDANVVLGILNQTHLLNGRMEIDADASLRAMARLAKDLGMSVMEAAHGILRVVTANMAKAIRVVSVERGYDPRDYSMLAFGGAGPLHATRLARELDIPRVIIPKTPGVMCATGLVNADLRSDFSLTHMADLHEGTAEYLLDGIVELADRADAWLASEGVAEEARQIKRRIDLRYQGQGYELTIDWPETGPEDFLREARRRFDGLHRQLYGYAADDAGIQVTAIRVEAVGVVSKPDAPTYPKAANPVSSARIGERMVWRKAEDAVLPCPLYDRRLLQFGHTIEGPAVIEQMDTTTFVVRNQVAKVDKRLNLILETEE